MITSYHNIRGGAVGGIGRYFKDRLKLLGLNAAKDAVGMENSYAKEYFTKKAEDPKYRKKMEQQEAKEDPEFAEKLSQIKNPQQWVEFYTSHGKENISNYIDKKFFDPIANSYIEKFNLDPDSKSYKAGSFVGESAAYMLEPPILPTKKLKAASNLAKFSTKAAARAKNFAINAPLGVAEGVLYSTVDNPEGSLKDRLVAGIFGAAGKTLSGQITPKLAKTQQMYKDAKSGKYSRLDPNIKRNREVLEAVKDTLGPDALSPELLGDLPGMRILQNQSDPWAKKRTSLIEKHIDNKGITADRMLVSGLTPEETADILPNRLIKRRAIGKEKYGRTKEKGVGIQGKLHPEDADELIEISKDLKNSGIKTDLIEGKNNNDVYINYDRSKNLEDTIFQEYVPTAEDIIYYDQKLSAQLTKEYEKPIKDGSKIEILESSIDKLKNIFNRSAKRAGEGAVNLNEVKNWYSKNVFPLSTNEAIKHNIRIDNPNTLATTKSTQKQQMPDTHLAHDSYKASQTQIHAETNWIQSTEKEQLAFLEQRFDEWKNLDKVGGETQKIPTSIYNFYHSLPIYMKNQKNAKGVVKEFLERAKKLHQTAKAFQSIATGQDAQMASRQAIRDLTQKKATPTGLAGLFHYLKMTTRLYKNSQYRKAMNQKNIKYYLNPELLDEMIIKKKYNMTRAPKAFRSTMQKLYEDNKDEDNKD
jgi:hypothetical protein